MTDMRLVVTGAGGRMGRTLVKAIAETSGLALVGATEGTGSPLLGQDSGVLAGLGPNRVPVVGEARDLLMGADAIIDFTVPQATRAFAKLAAESKLVHVIGTTGLSAEDEAAIKQASSSATIVKSGNMSLGVNLLAALVREAAKTLPHFDIEILEMHHRLKVDAPSGTALLLGEAAADGRQISLKEHEARARDGQVGARPEGAIGFASLRGGTVVGDHTVTLAGPFERIELTHRAEDRMIFARGALAAARWGQGKKPGLYGMTDVLGLAR